MQCKLRPLEAICVAGAVEDCLDRLRVLQSLTPSVITQRDELSNILGNTVAQIIKEQKVCEEKYEVLVKRRSELKSLSNKTRYKKNQDKIEAQAHELQELTRELCKHLRESPNVSQNLLKIQTERTDLITHFESFRKELLSTYSFQGIYEWASGRTTAYNKMMQIMQQDKDMQKEIKDLDEKIRKTEAEMARQLEDLDIKIKASKEELQQTQARIEDVKANRDDERQARLEAQQNMNELNQSRLTQQVINAKLQLQNEKNVHSVTLSYFDRRRAHINQMMKEWTDKYETDVKAETEKLQGFKRRIDAATTDYNELKPEKEEAERLMHLETERAKERAKQNEMRNSQTTVMNKIKILYLLHSKIRGPLPKPKRGKKKK
ncbi:hypothetical protein TVAG_463560 [Trichomonas vaginalis G3]|uniref:Dynein regulatory complex protein 9 n=1 Tax=Trichomonas vaginalis (strain ATCC PRA-98 / G3) TaxID=412133 RepID=A2EH28_TRIV3|nr:sperm axoneme assembly [Trichomonas vaginalis G3]EAY08076.1 hypothetical protein TVAG_463560 [Trichomonas vaginalis G3]KAI5543007.1 sperm axoneme assembly [Trichomonas vaginalis G3]|eukprot:XP_001320299.1 hypothetical protein [Trichomonas vaginalis G3]